MILASFQDAILKSLVNLWCRFAQPPANGFISSRTQENVNKPRIFPFEKLLPTLGCNGYNGTSSLGRIKNYVPIHGKMSHNPLACHPFRRVHWRLAVSDGNGVVRKDAPSQYF